MEMMEFNDENIFNNLGQNALLGRSRSRGYEPMANIELKKIPVLTYYREDL